MLNGSGIPEILTGPTETHNTCLAVMVNGSSAVTSLLLVQLTASSIQAHPLPLASVCVCVSVSVLLSVALFNSSVNGEGGHTQGRRVHTHIHTSLHSLGALICLNE